jgi:hypothetical protein
MIITNLEHLDAIAEHEGSLTGGVYADAGAISGASPGQGYAGAAAGAKGDQTKTFTDTTVKVYNSGTSNVSDASGIAYAGAQSGNSSSQAYATSLSYSVHN